MRKPVELSVIVPVFNEEKNIPLMHDRVTKALLPLGVSHEIIFVNDGSRDRSIEVVKELSTRDEAVKYIDFSRNFGHQIAVSAGLDHCLGNKVVIIDADLQDPPELIVEMYNRMKDGFEVVYAKRRSRKGESFLKKFTARLFYRLLSRLTTFEIPVDTGDFRIIDRKIVDILRRMPEQNKYLRGQIAWAGFRQTYVEYDRDERMYGKTGYSYSKMLRFAFDGITAFSNFPLRFATIAGFTVSGVAFLLILYTLYSRIILGDFERGWASEMVSILFIGGIQLIGIGIIGEYISRISSNVRNRPLYVVNESTAGDEDAHSQDTGK